MTYNTKKLACILFVSANIFLSGFMYDRAFAQTENNITKINVETTFSNATYNEPITDTNLMSSINELDITIQNLDASYFQVDSTFAKNTLHDDLMALKHLILDGEYTGAFNGFINMAKKIQAFVKSSGQDKVIPIIYQIIESVKDKSTPPEPGGYNLVRSYDTHPDLPIQSVYLMRTIPVTEADFTIQNLDNSYLNALAKNTIHHDLEEVKHAILNGDQYATYSILVNMTKKIQGSNLIKSFGQDKILPMIDTLIESVKIETTPITGAPSTPLEHYVYNPNPEEPWKISPWVVIGLLVTAVTGWAMFAIYKTRSRHP